MQTTKAGVIADGELLDLIRRVVCFGLTLTRIYIHKESSRHSELLDEVTQYLDKGSYLSWDEYTPRVFNSAIDQSRSAHSQKNIIHVGETLRTQFDLTCDMIKRVLGAQHFLDTNSVLLRPILLRSAYLYPLHVLQAELLKREREHNLEGLHAQMNQDALLVSISGIAAGMQNTG